MSISDQQNNLWQERTDQQVKAELCNVLYERELKRLSVDDSLDISALRRKIGSLPFYIGRAAESIGSIYSPLDLDSSNASWLAPQSAKPLSQKHDEVKCREFYLKNAKFALTVPIAISLYGIEHIVIDTIDDIDIEGQKIHCNQNGWFSVNGDFLQEQRDIPNEAIQKRLLKPSKLTFSAACCGHQWKGLQKTNARALSLRELLLATRINWHNFGKLLAPKKA